MRTAPFLGVSSLVPATIGAWLAACGAGVDPPMAPLPNVVLIVMDTVRADHLSCYGYERNTTPAIDRLAAGATRYAHALSTAPWTLPSHASLFTGLYPYEHGVRTHLPADGTTVRVPPLAEGHLTLAEVLKDEGYSTAAAVANFVYLDRAYQLDQGFDVWHVAGVPSSNLNEQIFEQLDALAEAPFLLFINYMDAHRNYNTQSRPGFIDPPAIQDQGELLDALLAAVRPGGPGATEELVGQVTDQYDTGLANLDESIGQLLEKLSQMELLDNTLVLVTSDHGEYLGEHGLVEHSKDIYEEALFVPLIIKAPGQTEGRVEEGLVSIAHVPRLVLSLLPASRFGPHIEAFPVRPAADPIVAENYFTRPKEFHDEAWGDRFHRIRRALYAWPYKYIDSSDGNHELYLLSTDPGETTNLLTSEPRVAEELRGLLEAALDRPHGPGGSAPFVPMDAELEESMRALGYVAE